MYPDPIFLDMTLYDIFMIVGFVSALIFFRVLADREKMFYGIQNLAIIGAFLALVGGYFAAVGTQSFYHFRETGKWELAGATFYGGLIGGAAVFLLFYFSAGPLFCRGKHKGDHIRAFLRVSDFAAVGIASAHGFGRIGCFTAGCCHGVETDSFLGIYMPAVGAKVYPVQLYEAVFLFILCGVLLIRCTRRGALQSKTYCLPLYMASYAVWRFLCEFLRGDERGTSLLPFLTPSQQIALLLLIAAIPVFFAERAVVRRRAKVDPSC